MQNIPGTSLETFPGRTTLRYHHSTTHPPCELTLHSHSALKTPTEIKDPRKPSSRPGHNYHEKYEENKAIAVPVACC